MKDKGNKGDKNKIKIPNLKPRNPFVLPPNKRHEDKRSKVGRKVKHKGKED